MSDTIKLKLTRKGKAAAKRLARFHRYVDDEIKISPYARHAWLCARDDEETLANAVLRAIKKCGA